MTVDYEIFRCKLRIALETEHSKRTKEQKLLIRISKSGPTLNELLKLQEKKT